MAIDKENLKVLAQSVKPDCYMVPEPYEEDRRYSPEEISSLEFSAAASPEAVLALLAEIDRLESEAMPTAAVVQSDREQIDQLKAENETLRDGANFRAIQSLRADCEALRKDAERYRWLTEKAGPSWGDMLGDKSTTPAEKAAEIDAAMAKERSNEH